MSKQGSRLTRLGVLAPVALSACIDASVLAAPAAGAILSTVLKELSKAFMLKKWFHGVMSAKDAEHLLMQRGKNGSYLVRESQNHPGKYVLSVRVRDRVRHVMIRREQNKYDVGSGENFEDLTDLIEHCRTYPLTENSGDVLRLMQPVNGFKPRRSCFNRRSSSVQVEMLRCDEASAGPSGEVMTSEPITPVFGKQHQLTGNGFYGNFVGGGDIVSEYHLLCQMDEYSNFTTFEGRRGQNQAKNRYRNVVPYDQTRVVLARTLASRDLNDYINASYIKPKLQFGPSRTYRWPKSSTSLPKSPTQSMSGTSSEGLNEEATVSNSSHEELGESMGNLTVGISESELFQNDIPGVVKNKYYIAAQGCILNTINDFWAMITEQDVRVIAMIGGSSEDTHKKCDVYWPLNGHAQHYGSVHVYTIRECIYTTHIIREFEVTDTDTLKCTVVYHYQFKDWPDHQVPLDCKNVLMYQEEINNRMLQVSQGIDAPKENILCVHCSAGIGRTGTFVALDMLIDEVKVFGLNTHIDIFSTVGLCRSQRAGMVQNAQQYEFLYDAMRHYLDRLIKLEEQRTKPSPNPGPIQPLMVKEEMEAVNYS